MDVIPYFLQGNPTCRAQSAVVGGRFLTVVGDLAGDIAGAMPEDGHPRVAHGIAGRPIGVAARDTAAGGTVLCYTAPVILPIQVGAAVAAGADLVSLPDGRAVPTGTAGAGAGVGAVSLSAAGAANETVMAKLV